MEKNSKGAPEYFPKLNDVRGTSLRTSDVRTSAGRPDGRPIGVYLLGRPSGRPSV